MGYCAYWLSRQINYDRQYLKKGARQIFWYFIMFPRLKAPVENASSLCINVRLALCIRFKFKLPN